MSEEPGRNDKAGVEVGGLCELRGCVGDALDRCRKGFGAQQWQRKGTREVVVQIRSLDTAFGSL